MYSKIRPGKCVGWLNIAFYKGFIAPQSYSGIILNFSFLSVLHDLGSTVPHPGDSIFLFGHIMFCEHTDTRDKKKLNGKHIFVVWYKFFVSYLLQSNYTFDYVSRWGVKQTISVDKGKVLLKVLTCRHPQLVWMCCSLCDLKCSFNNHLSFI